MPSCPACSASPTRRGTLDNGYLQVDTRHRPGRRLVGQTIQFHGTADRYALAGAKRSRPVLGRRTATADPAVTLRERRFERGPGGRLHLRPREVCRLHAPGESGLGRARARRHRPIRSDDLFFGAKRAMFSPTGSTSKGRDPAGGRAAAAAGEPDRGDEPRSQATAALLVPAARREGRRGDDRGRPRQQRHRRPLRPVHSRRSGRLRRRGLGVREGNLVHLPDTPLTDAQAAAFERGIRDRLARDDQLR